MLNAAFAAADKERTQTLTVDVCDRAGVDASYVNGAVIEVSGGMTV